MNKKEFYAGGFLYTPETKEVLLMLRDDKTPQFPNKWSFFGGANEGSETPEECCVREWKEELGIDVDARNLIPLRDYFNELHGKWRYVFYIESKLKKSEMVLGEGARFDWIPLEKVFEYALTPVAQDDLNFFIKKISTKN